MTDDLQSETDIGETPRAHPVPDAVLLLHAGEAAACEPLLAHARASGIRVHEHGLRQLFDEGPPADAPAHWVVLCDEGTLGRVIDCAERAGASLGVVPLGNPTWLRRLLRLPVEAADRIELAFSGRHADMDVLRCNGEVVLGQVAIGDVPFLDRRGRNVVHVQPTRWQRWLTILGLSWIAIRRLFAIRPTAVRIGIGDDERMRATAITGAVLLENDLGHLAGRVLDERPSMRDGRVSALLVAPTSVVSYLAFLLRAAVPGRTPVARMPRALSYVKTRRLVIEASAPLPYRIDGQKRSAARIEAVVATRALRINSGARFVDIHAADDGLKDSVRLRHLPESEARLAMIRDRLPVFTRAMEEDFKELLLQLRDGARTTTDYVALMVLATLVATLGLLLNSAAVLIGAMLLAPLMVPIISGALGVLRRDTALTRSAVQTVGVGVGLTVATAVLLALVMPIHRITPEIAARLQPTLLDLGVAVFSGIAGAYAYARESVMKSLPGVAIAVALVPPLAVAGLGIGWLDVSLFWGALLLFLTNLFGIALAAAATFLVLGFGPVRRSTVGLRLPLLAVVLVSLPLYWSFSHISTLWQVERAVTAQPWLVEGRTLWLDRPQVSVENGLLRIRADVYADGPVAAGDYDALRHRLAGELGREIELDLAPRIRR